LRPAWKNLNTARLSGCLIRDMLSSGCIQLLCMYVLGGEKRHSLVPRHFMTSIVTQLVR
jgi:hypothetical protein